MAGFVCWLAGQYEQVRQSLRAEVEDLRQKAIGADAHCRTPEIVANLALGLRYFIAFAKAVGVITETEGQALWQRGWTALGQAGSQQADHQAANEPARRFIELLLSAIASGRAHLADCDGKAPNNAGAWGWRSLSTGTGGEYPHEEWKAYGDRIGWVDGPDVLLDPDASYRAAQNMAGANGDALSITARTLRKRLGEKGMVIRQSQDELLSRRVLEGRMCHVLQLADGILSAQSRISPISTNNLSDDPEHGPAEGNAGNAGKHPGDTPAGNVVLEL